ncbi:hypothetical protein [Neisseria sicca]|uniref:hypothetical protein n=1 Tax=Neisseria sicca TaxID=490 RepID=UPI00030FF7CA|nr:hypothetical protein [Neisseria sicca]
MHPFQNNDGKRRSSETDKKPDCPSDFMPSRNFQTTAPYFPKSCSLRMMSGV